MHSSHAVIQDVRKHELAFKCNQLSTAQIMVIDDEPLLLSVMRLMLVDLGCQDPVCYEHSRDALQAMDNEGAKPAVIVLDLRMPEMDGVQVLRHLGERRYAGDLILLSGEDGQTLRAAEALARAHKMRVIGVHMKPVTSEQLAESLAKHVKDLAATPFRARATYSPNAIAHAIREGELVNYYQPKVDTSSGAVVGVESLVRWNHPTDGLVFPDQFIPTAESSGLIRDLTRQVLVNALSQSKAWREVGIELNVAVNVSMDDLSSLDFADFVIEQTNLAEVLPESVTLELTESRLVPNMTAVLDVLTRLQIHGFGLSIDDFGTGHSSLVQLRDLPFDELKIDRSFTRNAWNDARLRAFFQASVDLARVLGLSSVAEGVEDANDLEYVRKAGCRITQGYFIAKPMPAESLLEWLNDWELRLTQESLFRSVA